MKALIALDGSEIASHVLPTVRRLIKMEPEMEIHLVSVLSPKSVKGTFLEHYAPSAIGTAAGTISVAPPPPMIVESQGDARQRIETDVRERLEVLGHEQFSGMAVKVHVKWFEKPAVALVEAAKELGADVILMTTQSRTGLAHTLTGSVAEEVVRKVTCPVLLVGPSVAT